METTILMLAVIFTSQNAQERPTPTVRPTPWGTFHMEAKKRIWKRQRAKARKRAIQTALKKSVYKGAQEFVKDSALKKAKRALRKTYGRFISSYRLIEEQTLTDQKRPIYRVKLQVKIDMVALRRALKPPPPLPKGHKQAYVTVMTASLKIQGTGIDSILPAQVALESSLRAQGFGVQSSLTFNKTPQMQFLGECHLLGTNSLPDSKSHGATVQCTGKISFFSQKARQSNLQLSSKASGIASSQKASVQTALTLAGIKLGKQMASKMVKSGIACSSRWTLHIRGPVGFEKMQSFNAALSKALPQTAKVTPLGFRRGLMITKVELITCRKNLSFLVKSLALEGLDHKITTQAPFVLNVELKQKSSNERIVP